MSGIDQLFNDADIFRAERDASEASSTTRAWRKLAEKREVDYNDMANINAANLAYRYALQKQLAKVDPNNPLLRDAALKEKIHDLGERAFNVNRNFDDARDAGTNYPIPGRS